jgi:hypothetical protein
VTRRYEIQEMLSQDAHGVIFHAVDRETDADVVLRRFFPFGPGGGGLEAEERDAYCAAVARLKSVSHPTLRTILDGGCDPVDGMPYLVTEWIEGKRLSEHLKEKPLSAGSAKALLDHALEASMVLASVLQAEEVWVETAPETVILSDGSEGRTLTFWISPVRWLAADEERKGLMPLVELGEAAMHWQGRVISDQAGEGLGAWFKAIRTRSDRWTLEEARATLHAAQSLTGADPASTLGRSQVSIPTVAMVAKAAPPASQPRLKQQSSAMPWVISGVLVATATGLLVWRAMRPAVAPPAVVERPAKVVVIQAPGTQAPARPAAGTEPAPDPEMDAAARASALAEKLSRERAAEPAVPMTQGGHDTTMIDPQLIQIGKELRDKIGSRVTFKGRIHEVRTSGSGKTIYIEFGGTRDSDALCARHQTREGDADMSKESLQELVGKEVSITGDVVADPSGRIAIDVKERSQIEVKDA